MPAKGAFLHAIVRDVPSLKFWSPASYGFLSPAQPSSRRFIFSRSDPKIIKLCLCICTQIRNMEVPHAGWTSASGWALGWLLGRALAWASGKAPGWYSIRTSGRASSQVSGQASSWASGRESGRASGWASSWASGQASGPGFRPSFGIGFRTGFRRVSSGHASDLEPNSSLVRLADLWLI